jgi:hypothetical protein
MSSSDHRQVGSSPGAPDVQARVESQIDPSQQTSPGPPHGAQVGVGDDNGWHSVPVAQRGESSQHGWPGWPQPAMHVPAEHTPPVHGDAPAQQVSPRPPQLASQVPNQLHCPASHDSPAQHA